MMSFKTGSSISNKSSLLIEDLLKELSQKKNIRILFAAAWGSRAYGLESPTSDYDVRFVFAQEKTGKSLNEDTITDNGLKIDNYLIDYSGKLTFLYLINDCY
jgi:predicted nucleotidyltransferase